MTEQQSVSANASARIDEEILVRIATAADAAPLSRAAATFFLDTFGDANRREDMEAYLASAFSQARQHEELVDAALMEQCVATAREWGGHVLWLGVWERNSRAIAFYEKHGFQVVGEQPFLLGTDLQRDLVMARRLTNAG